jgi:hypothetical protein
LRIIIYLSRAGKRANSSAAEDFVAGVRTARLYVDNGALSAMWTDSAPMKQSRLAELGGTV